MNKSYYTYMHLLDDRLIYIGMGTKHPEHRTEGTIYPRAFNLKARKKNYKRSIKGREDDVVIVIVEEFDTREQAQEHEEYLHQLHREKFDFFKDINYRYKLYSQPQSTALGYKSVRCINTNEEFKTITKASKYFKLDSGNLHKHLQGNSNYNYCGKHPATKEPLKFEYVK